MVKFYVLFGSAIYQEYEESALVFLGWIQSNRGCTPVVATLPLIDYFNLLTQETTESSA